MTDTKLLKERVEQCGLKLSFIAEQLGISYQAFFNKSNNKSEFKASELQILRELLNLSDMEFKAIFLATL